MELKIYDSLSKNLKNLSETRNKPIRLFVCGPTVYDFSHIGHARTYIFFDFLTKYLKSLGKKVFYLQNITDIDDKIIKRSQEKNIDSLKFASQMTKAYLADMKTFGIGSVTKYAPATKFIKEIERQVKTLIDKGFAYKIENDGWYFNIKKFSDYGRLSGRTAEAAEDSVSRIDESINKTNKGDFCVWKFRKENEPFWKSKLLGDGRPGWHIEDTAISDKFFGPQYEIHGGGSDLKFPHHEAEIAQEESASGSSPMVNIWMHTGMLTVDGKKMSKSLNNFITIKDFLEKHSQNALKLLVFSSNYRSPLDYNEPSVNQAENSIRSIKEFLTKISFTSKSKKPRQGNFDINSFEMKFNQALDNDLNTAEALAVIFGLISEINKTIWSLSNASLKKIEKFIKTKLKIFGIELKEEKIPVKILKMAKGRELLRVNQQFIKSDALRNKITALGYIIEDTPLGPLVLRKY